MVADTLEMLFREFCLPTMAARCAEMLQSAEAQNWGYRKLLLQLHRAGLIGLPAKRCAPPNNMVNRATPAPLLPLWETPRRCALAQLGPLDIRQVRRRPEEALFGRLMQAHHYLRYAQAVHPPRYYFPS